MRARATLAALLFGGISLSATVVVPTEFREVVGDAGLIVRGRVTDVRAEVVRDRGIESVGTISVEAVLKGSAERFVSVRVPGGVVGTTRTVMVGAPHLTPDEQAVFFLKRGADNYWRPVGLSMGIYRLQFDRATRQTVINAPILLGQTASAGPVVRGDVRRRPMAVAEFDSLVRLVAAQRTGGTR
jgi:hypothetical protein